MPRVALATPNLDRDGGVAAHVRDSAHALRTAGHDVVVVAGRPCAAEDWDGPTVVLPALLHERVDAAERRRALAGLRAAAPDVVHAHGLLDGHLTRDLHEVAPLVVSAHGYVACSPGLHVFGPGEACDRHHGPGCIPNMLLRGCLHAKDPRPVPRLFRATTARVAALHAADAAVAYSRALLRHLERNGVAHRHLVPLFVPGPREVPPPAAARRLLFVGRVVQAKGLDVLVRALAEVDAELEVCGDGWALPRVRALARRLGVDDRIAFLGWCGAERLEEAYARADVVVLPSTWPEPFGLVGLEALARERPVVASDTGGVRDWLDDGRTGVLVPPGDPRALAAAVATLLDDPARRAVMGREGAARVRARFTPERHVAALEAVYDAVSGR